MRLGRQFCKAEHHTGSTENIKPVSKINVALTFIHHSKQHFIRDISQEEQQ